MDVDPHNLNEKLPLKDLPVGTKLICTKSFCYVYKEGEVYIVEGHFPWPHDKQIKLNNGTNGRDAYFNIIEDELVNLEDWM